MSRNNTPSVLSSLNAYDSDSDNSDGDDEEEDISARIISAGSALKVADLLQVPPLPPFLNLLPRSGPTSREPSPRKVTPPIVPLVREYTEEDEDNFDFHPVVQDDQEDEEMEEATSQEDEIVVEVEDDNESNTAPIVQNEESGEISPKCRRLDDLLPPPEGECDPVLQAKFAKMMGLKAKGRNANEIIQNMKGFRNPAIYHKLILLCDIDENGTNFPDPPVYQQSSYYDELDKVQRLEMERRFKAKEKSKLQEASSPLKVGFISGTTIPLPKMIPPPGLATGLSATITQGQKPSSTYIRAFGNLAFKN